MQHDPDQCSGTLRKYGGKKDKTTLPSTPGMGLWIDDELARKLLATCLCKGMEYEPKKLHQSSKNPSKFCDELEAN